MDDFLDEFQGERKKFDYDFGKDPKRRIAHILEAENPVGNKRLEVKDLESSYLGITPDVQCSLSESIARDIGKRSHLPQRWTNRPIESILYELPDMDSGKATYNDGGMDSVRPIRTEAMMVADKVYNNIIFKEPLEKICSISDIESLLLASDIYSRLSQEGKNSVKATVPSLILKESIDAFKLENTQTYTGKNRLVLEFNDVIEGSLGNPWSEGEIDESLAKIKYGQRDIYDFMEAIDAVYQKTGKTADASYLTNILYFRDSAIENCPDKTITFPKVEKSLYNYLGRGLKKSLIVEGDVGEGVGYLMNNPATQITVKGSAGKKTGFKMKNGKLIIEGNAEIEGLEGGEIWVNSDAHVEKSTMRGGKVFKNGKQVYPGWFGRLLKK